jgi:hypothetical protein
MSDDVRASFVSFFVTALLVGCPAPTPQPGGQGN